MHSQFTMTFPSFHVTTLTHPSHPRHSLLSPTLQFTSLHFWMIYPTPSLRLIYHYPNPFPEITWFTGVEPRFFVCQPHSLAIIWTELFQLKWLVLHVICPLVVLVKPWGKCSGYAAEETSLAGSLLRRSGIFGIGGEVCCETLNLGTNSFAFTLRSRETGKTSPDLIYLLRWLCEDYYLLGRCLVASK
jgi:hypothetical protein